MANFHGANKPTGEARTWPNEITREGIREQEYVLWGSLPLAHYGALPFTRLAAGHADFLPGYVQPKFLKNTTALFQMASVVVFSSPFLCWPDNPQAYLDSPLLEFVRTVPVTWDETRVLDGSKIGDTVIMALGTKANRLLGKAAPNVEVSSRGYVLTDADGTTSQSGVFAGGDIVTGSATVILAMGAGKKAAQAMDRNISRREVQKGVGSRG